MLLLGMVIYPEFDNCISEERFRELCLKAKVGLNYRFAIQQKADEKMIKRVLECHHKKDIYLERLIKAIEDKNLKKIKINLKKIVEWDFKVQKAWGFPKDASKLTWTNNLFYQYPELNFEINKISFIENLKD